LCGEHRWPFVGSPSAISYRKSSERESLPALRAVPARRTPPGAVPTLVMSVTAPSGVSAAGRGVRGGWSALFCRSDLDDHPLVAREGGRPGIRGLHDEVHRGAGLGLRRRLDLAARPG